MAMTRSSGKKEKRTSTKFAKQVGSSKRIATSSNKKIAKSNKKKPAKKVTQNTYFQSNLKGVVEKVLKLKLFEAHETAIKDFCPFWELVELIRSHKVTMESVTKGNNELLYILRTFNKTSKFFSIGGKKLKLMKDGVVKAFGVMGGTKKVFHSADKCVDKSMYNFFKRTKRLRTTHVAAILTDAVDSQDDNLSQNLAALITLYLLTSLFAPTCGATLSWNYKTILSEPDKLNEYDWAGYIFEKLMASLEKDFSRQIRGCVMLPLNNEPAECESLGESISIGNNDCPSDDVKNADHDMEDGVNCTVEEESEILKEKIKI